MILPIIISYPAFKSFFGVLFFGDVKDKILAWVFLIQESLNLNG